MTLAEIREMPATFLSKQTGLMTHESVLRSYQCLMKVREVAITGTNPKLILEIIDDCMDAPKVDAFNGVIDK